MADESEQSEGLIPPYGVYFQGPMRQEVYFNPMIDGYKIPYIQVFHTPQDAEGDWTLVLDDRFAISGGDKEVRKWLHFIANAMAVAAGRSAFGRFGGTKNPFEAHMIEITGVEYGDEDNH